MHDTKKHDTKEYDTKEYDTKEHGTKENNTEENDSIEIEAVLSDIKSDDHVQEMKKYIQHGRVTTYEHCERVAELSHKIDRLLSLHSNQKTLLTGAMLHDFYLYDWHNEDNGEHRLHGFHHAEKACANAKKYFDIDEKTMHVINSHMWPLNIKSIPKSKEAWIVCIADKCVSLHETLFRREGRNKNENERHFRNENERHFRQGGQK